MTSPTQKYIPGIYYKATGGVTQEDFEDMDEYARSLPYPDEYATNLGALALGVSVYNFSGSDQAIVISDPNDLNTNIGNRRYNQKEKESLVVQDGTGFFFPMHPRCFVLSIKGYSINRSGQKVITTALSRDLQSIAGLNIELLPGDEPGETEIPNSQRSYYDLYSHIVNNTGNDATATLAVLPPPGSAQKMRAEKLSRQTDDGPRVFETKKMRPLGTWDVIRPPPQVVIRALQPEIKRSGNMMVERVPPETDYVSNAKVTASIAQVAVLFKQANSDALNWGTYGITTIKFVNSILCSNVPQ